MKIHKDNQKQQQQQQQQQQTIKNNNAPHKDCEQLFLWLGVDVWLTFEHRSTPMYIAHL